MGNLFKITITTALLNLLPSYVIFSHIVDDSDFFMIKLKQMLKTTNITFLSDLIGVFTHIGPHDLASKTSKEKLHKVLIQDLE
jgi:hypothetical protein